MYLGLLLILLLFVSIIDLKIVSEKSEFCNSLQCDQMSNVKFCGIKEDGEGFRLRLFDNECALLEYGCKVKDNTAYGVISMEYCELTFKANVTKTVKLTTNQDISIDDTKSCVDYNCSYPTDSKEVCGIRQDDDGFRVKLFENKCQLWKHNCEQKLQFSVTNFYVCNGIESSEKTEVLNKEQTVDINGVTVGATVHKLKNIVIVDGAFINRGGNINESIDNFFATTHVLGLPMKEIKRDVLNETTRKMMLKIAGPVKVFQPWITIPKNISEDYYHRPTLSSCFHKCPVKCPETYAPVCGVPGIVAREPSIMFQNHCFMDVAQCKMHWEDKSPTALSSYYIESSFLFCLGDELNGLYRFLPLIRTLQHMGRLKKKGHFRYKLNNMRFFNNLLSREPKLMGLVYGDAGYAAVPTLKWLAGEYKLIEVPIYITNLCV